MGKLSSRAPVRPTPVIRTAPTPSRTLRTGNGAVAYERDAQSELFLLATTNFVSENTAYEAAGDRDTRFRDLVRQCAAQEPLWTAQLLSWLRGDGNMRSASIVGAIEYGIARHESPNGAVENGRQVRQSHFKQAPTPRRVLDSVLQRADEPAEALGYWLSTYGRPVPKWLKRGLGDAAQRLYTPFNVLKYDGQDKPVRFADVLEFSQIERKKVQAAEGRPDDSKQAIQGVARKNAKPELVYEPNDFDPIARWIMDRRRGRAEGDYGIPMLRARKLLDSIPVADRRQFVLERGETTFSAGRDELEPVSLRTAGHTWESLSGWLQGPMDAAAWEAIIPSMGYMALLRNLRNFDQAGVSDVFAENVARKLADPEQVARSRQLPMRFLSAYNAAPSDRFKVALGKALDLSLGNIPVLGGRWLVLVDTSGSMQQAFSKDGTLHYWDAAALFGLAFAKRNEGSNVVSYSNAYYGRGKQQLDVPLVKGQSTLSALRDFQSKYFIGGGTDTAGAISRNYNGHDGVLLLTDEQANAHYGSIYGPVPEKVPFVTFNLAGYRAAQAASSPTRITVGGLSDSGFRLMSQLAARRAGKWPWEV